MYFEFLLSESFWLEEAYLKKITSICTMPILIVIILHPHKYIAVVQL